MPGVPMVGVFDTAFHQTMPAKSYIYALPYEFYEQDKVRRYGFHGTSHRYVSARAAAMLGKPIEELKIITCHLGNGSSVAAVDCGKSVDTSMGFTPLAGVPMGTRAGDLDAGILEYLMGKHGYDMKEMMTILNKKSGVLGISGVSSDFRDLENAAKEGNQRAELALEASSTVLRSWWALMPPPWAGWTPSCLPPVWVRTMPLPAWPWLRPGVHGSKDGCRGQQRPRQGDRHLLRRLQGEGAAHPHR